MTFLTRFAAAALALLPLSSCNRAEEGRPETGRRSGIFAEFTATRDIALDLTADRKEDVERTKATLGTDGSVIWTADDAISVFTSDGDKYGYDCKELINDGKSAVFKGEAPSGGSYVAIYPAQENATFNQQYRDVHAVIPSVQTAVAGSFDPAASLAIASTSGTELDFKNVGALVNFVVRDENVRTITLSGTATSSKAALAGGADINYNSGNPVFNVTQKSTEVTLAGEFIKGQRYYLVVYPGTYTDLELVFTDAAGRTATFCNPVQLELERNSNINLFDQEIPEGKWMTPSVIMASTIEVEADGAVAESSSVTLVAADGWNINVTYDGCVDFAYFDPEESEVVYSVSKNETAVERTGHITVTMSRDGYDDVSTTASVIQDAGTPVPPPVDRNWYLVTSTADLVAGDEYVIACNSKGVVATDFSGSNAFLGKVETTFSSDNSTISELPASALILTLGGSTDAWTFSNASERKLGATTTKKLAWGDGVSTWKIAIKGGTATITCTTTSYGYFQYNSGAPRFTTYTANQTAVQLYHRSDQSVTSIATGSGASSISASSAEVSGSYYCVSAVPSEAGVLYGLDAAYLSEKAVAATPSSKARNFYVTLTNLYASTTYYFKAYVIENGVTYYGSVQNFTTTSGGSVTPSTGGADYGWAELPAQTDRDRNGIDDKNPDYYYSHTFRADASSIRNFSCCYSKSKIHPVWVAAPMHKCYLGSSGRNDSYKADPNIKCTQNGKFDGYTRGHMVGSSDRTISVATNKQAFYYSNIGAQLSAGFNTGGGVWNNLEDKVDTYLCADTLYQVIGCIFDPFTDHYGDYQGKRTASGSDIPTAYYKALLRTKNGNTGKNVCNCSADELQCVAFVVIHNSKNKGRMPSANDMYSIAELEEMTGLTFFVNVPNAPKNSYKASDWGM